MPDARSAILSRLRAAPATPTAEVPKADFSVLAERVWPEAERLPRLRRLMEAVNTEFVTTTTHTWPDALRRVLIESGVRRLMTGSGGPAVDTLRAAWAAAPVEGQPELVAFDATLETHKDTLFTGVDAGLTTTQGAIADTGSLILWPNREEPRSLSLIPPLHVALLDPARIHDTLWDAMRAQRWAGALPTNALLVSGPSKTADIEQTLAYGVHGPKRLIVLVLHQDREQP